MTTETTTPEAKYTLITYRPNGERYEGCGDYVRYDSDLDLATDLSKEELRAKLIEKITHGEACCDNCPTSDNENEPEFAILKGGTPLFARGDNLYSFSPSEESEDTLTADRIWEEAHNLIRKDKEEKAAAAEKAKAEAAAKATVAKKAAEEAARLAAEAAERKRFEEPKAKYEPKPEPVPEPLAKAMEKAKAELVTA